MALEKGCLLTKLSKDWCQKTGGLYKLIMSHCCYLSIVVEQHLCFVTYTHSATIVITNSTYAVGTFSIAHIDKLFAAGLSSLRSVGCSWTHHGVCLQHTMKARPDSLWYTSSALSYIISNHCHQSLPPSTRTEALTRLPIVSYLLLQRARGICLGLQLIPQRHESTGFWKIQPVLVI